MMALERSTHKNAAGVEETLHTINPERFKLACFLFGVTPHEDDRQSEKVDFRDAMHAFEVSAYLANACDEAQHQATRGVLRTRREGRQRG